MKKKATYSKRQTIKGLRRFLYVGAFWGAYGQIQAVSGPIFTGFALSLSLTEVHIATLASVAALAGLIQPFSVFLSSRFRDKKRFIISVGFMEITLVMSVVTIPLFVPVGIRVPVLMAMVLLGTTMGHIASPVFSGWYATLIPEDIRARYLSKRMIVVTVASIVVGYGAGKFLDVVSGYRGFCVLFPFGFLTGIAGYLSLIGVAFKKETEIPPSPRLLQIFGTSLRNRNFAFFLLFYASWLFSAAMAGPFYSIFMLKTLSIPYSTVALLTSLSMIVQIVGYRFWGDIVDRYGSKPLLQVLLIPQMIIPALWVLGTPANYLFVLPAIMIVSGLIGSGLASAVSPLLFALLPENEEKEPYFASWAFFNSIVGALAPAIGGILVSRLQPMNTQITPSLGIGHLQMMFLISAALMVVPNILLRRVVDAKASTPGYLLGQLRRGNPFMFAYNFYLFGRTESEGTRAQAARAMGRSQSPMAVERLVAALDDPSPRVRSEAAKGLGETKNADAVAPLIEELDDEESDIRSEAAEALGKLRHPQGIDPLFSALDDVDMRIRMSAIRALAIIGGPEVQERLYTAFSGPFDRVTFPALVDALSHMKDLRIIRPTIEQLKDYRSPVIRLQLLNALCRTLGAKDRFYRLLSLDELERTDQIHRLLESSRKKLSTMLLLDADARDEVLRLLDSATEYFDLEQEAEMAQCLGAVANRLEQAWIKKYPDPPIPANQIPNARIKSGLQAIQVFLRVTQAEGIVQEQEIFLTLCLGRAVELLERVQKG
ncbi:MAG: MFS transporter [Candidatus Latescibacterota bacterium]